jgi:hypothetical protein
VVHQQPSGRLIPNLIKLVIMGGSELNKLLTLWLSMDQALKSLSRWVWEAATGSPLQGSPIWN